MMLLIMRKYTYFSLCSLMVSLILIGGLILPVHATASEVLAAEVVEQNDVYQVYLKMHIDAPYDYVYESLTDYANIHTLSQSIIESVVLKFTPPKYRIKLVSEGCIWFVCRTVTQVQDVHDMGNGRIKIDVIPELSDIRQSQQYWQIEAGKTAENHDHTMVSYRASIEPDFWIPPFFGSMIFKERLLEEGQYILNNIELNANDTADDPDSPDED